MSLFKTKFSAIITTGFIAGIMDGTAAVIQYLIKGGSHPENIFKYIASAMLGPSALKGGWDIVALGILFHLCIAMIFAAFFYWIYPHLGKLRDTTIITGILYGLCVWAIMNLVVVPLSRIGQLPFHPVKMMIAGGILILFIGIPVSLLTHKYYLYKK
jgi:hypothetical protein